jgi:hypothetical protein
MSSESSEFIIRRPRHDAVQDSLCHVWVERIARDPKARQDVALVDVSRLGLQVKLTDSLEPDEPLVVHIQHSQAKLDVALAGRVRWQRQCHDGHWAVGCVFDQAIDYEVMGELFLCGILSMQA